jgi:cellulose synthase/poly-beta-1,6-N-acetylglucosamine synthase-like glycosyltransferase
VLTILIPAHNEEHRLPACIDSLATQTGAWDRIIVLADNCDDNTALVAESYGCEVFTTTNNENAKAGALNQWLQANLPNLNDDHFILVMDADGWLDPDFIENAMRFHGEGFSAVGGVFRAESNGTFVGFCQANEYERYRYILRGRKGRTLVLTGTATLFTAGLMKEIQQARTDGNLPSSGNIPETVYSINTLVEDLELTLAIKHLHHKVIAPIECSLETETMDTWRGLAKQRYRWKLGALQTAWAYGFTKHTNIFHRLQLLNLTGIIATIVYLLTVAVGVILGGLHLHEIWLGVTLVYVVERAITVSGRGWKAMLVAALLFPEMVFDITLQFVQLRAILAWMLGRKQLDWYGGKAT